MSTIVVGYDGSDCGRAALDAGVEYAKLLGDDVLVVFGYAPRGAGGGEVPSHREVVHEFGEKITAEATERTKDAGVKVEVELLPEKAHQALMSAATEHDARMIVVGTYGEAPLKGAILGSTTYKLVQLAEQPVLVVGAD